MTSVPYQEPTAVAVNGITLHYDAFGQPEAPPLLLIGGLGVQLIGWDEALCRRLAETGLYVIRYDNRDVGLSTHFTSAGMPDFASLLLDRSLPVPYTLEDMAADAVGLLNALNLSAAHIVGASMGGMIAQVVAIHYPERVLTLTSIMSTTGAPSLPPPTPKAGAVLAGTAPTDRASAMARSVADAHVLAGDYPVDEERVAERAAAAFEREIDPTGSARQMAAILVAPERTAALGHLRVSAIVLHGQQDPLIPAAHGVATARAIPGARLLIDPRLGHRLPPPSWPFVVKAIVRHVTRPTRPQPSVK